MPMSREARVGLSALAGLVATGFLVVFLGRIHFTSAGYPLAARFSYVDSLKTQAPVLYGGGVKIGEVDGISIDAGRVLVSLHIEDGVRIPADSLISIHTSGILGEKYVQVSPGSDLENALAPGSKIEGIDPGSLDRTLQKVEALTAFLEPLLADPKFRGGVQNLLKGLDKVVADLGSLVSENRGDIRASVKDLKQLTGDLRARTSELQPVLKNAGKILSDANTKKVQGSLDNLEGSLAKLDRILTQIDNKKGTVGVLVYDEETGENLRTLLSDLKRHPWKLLWKK
jgi:phospholipid/cholesterol/gamma-HCH transport system substrate-binding protein